MTIRFIQLTYIYFIYYMAGPVDITTVDNCSLDLETQLSRY